MEGGVFLCGWKKSRRGFALWLKSQKNLLVEDEDFDAATEKLAEMVGDKTGDREAILEFQPLPPIETRLEKWTTPKIVNLGYNELVETSIKDSEMYHGGICSRCENPIGGRTKNPILIRGKIKGDIVAAVNSNPTSLLFSEKFLALLKPNELVRLKFKPTVQAAKGGQPFYELIGKSISPFVSFRGAEYNSITCWKCRQCRHRSLYPSHPDLGNRIIHFISRSDIPQPVPSIFVIGNTSEGLALCMTLKRWEQVTGKNGSKGIVTSPVGLVSDELLVRDPPLKTV